MIRNLQQLVKKSRTKSNKNLLITLIFFRSKFIIQEAHNSVVILEGGEGEFTGVH